MESALPIALVIVPIYGVEQYVRKCVESLITQQYDNLEIILVDDGSKDKSGLIIDELAALDPRIMVIHQENTGVSAARNSGLSHASGEYVLFVNGDDFVEPDYMSYFVTAAIEKDASMVVNTSNFSMNKMQQKAKDKWELWQDIDVIKGVYLGSIFVAVWNKL